MGRISEMLEADPLNGDEQFEIVQVGRTRRTSINTVIDMTLEKVPEKVYQYLQTTTDTVDMGEL